MWTFISILSSWNWAILQIYFFFLNMRYTSSIFLAIFWFPKFVTLKNNLNLYVSSILWVHQEFSNEVYFKYTLNLFLKYIWISFLGQKYTWSSVKVTNIHSKLELYLKYTFWIDAFFCKLKYTWGALSKFMYLYSNSEVYK